jgi:hypothetical protein
MPEVGSALERARQDIEIEETIEGELGPILPVRDHVIPARLRRELRVRSRLDADELRVVVQIAAECRIAARGVEGQGEAVVGAQHEEPRRSCSTRRRASSTA